MFVGNEEKTAGSARGAVAPATAAKVFSALFGVVLLGASASGAGAASRTISMYHIHTKERITVTYWRDGRYIPSALRKLNWFLRDWRKKKAVRMDPRTIDLIWKLHEDLGSKETIHIICGHRSAATNAMLRRIGRRVARRSRHITGQAIDFKFPDVPQWKVRNLALAYGIGGVGYYGEGRNGFVHVDTGNVRHWPRLPQYKLARIIGKYRKLIGRGWKRGGGDIMVAARSRRGNFNRHGRAAVGTADKQVLQRQIAALKNRIRQAEAARKAGTKKPAAPIPLPGVKPVLVASADGVGSGAVKPVPRPRPYEVLVLAASRMEITPASAPATMTNFASRNEADDPIGIVIANLPEDDTATGVPIEGGARKARRAYPRVLRSGKGDLAVALVSGEVGNVPVLDNLGARKQAVGTDGKGDLRLRLGMTPEELSRRDGAPLLQKTNHATSVFWPGVKADAGRGASGAGPQRVNRSGKGDLLTSARTPEKVRKTALEVGALQVGNIKPATFR